VKTIICGPCVGEYSRDWIVEQADAIAEQMPKHVQWVFKCSFDKSNRTRYESYRGLGLEQTLAAFEIIKKRSGNTCSVTTDIHESWQAAEVAPVVDIIQIPAMLCRQLDLVRAASKLAPCVNIKCGTNVSAEKMGAVVRNARAFGARNVWLTYRGSSYGDRLVFDPMQLWRLAQYAPVIADITHSAQDGSGVETLGDRTATYVYGLTAMAQDVDGLFIEAHENPEKAKSDAATQVKISQLGDLLRGFGL
jgi:2-dehydro-3-deoxyphosphooctonate aldolase (KDO 8-P synthase)